MHPEIVMAQVRTQMEGGATVRQAAERAGVPEATVKNWRRGRTRAFENAIASGPWRPPDAFSYAYLLGAYLGDGHIAIDSRRRVILRIHMDGLYPEIIEECVTALVLTRFGGRVRVLPEPNSRGVTVRSTWKGWLDAFPQHGPGRKHERRIELADWQRAIVDAHPGQFVRGLIHSDGCRTVNRFTTTLPSGRRREYAYTRYFFSNLSPDIRALFEEACAQIGVRTTNSNPRNVSISHRDSVAILEQIVGPKA